MGLFESIVNKIRDRGNCVICDFDFTLKFPKDFPEEFKFCCSCLEWAKLMLTDEFFYRELFASEDYITPTLKKILNRITLVE